MSVELNVADVDFLGDSFTFLDCPGSIEFQADAAVRSPACDAAVVVCEPDEKKVPALQLILKQLEDRGIPHFLFLNKIDKAEPACATSCPCCSRRASKPLVLRQIPIWENGIATGFVDLALERAFVYREHAPIARWSRCRRHVAEREKEARFTMLEQLADYDDELMEQLLDDVPPPRDKVFDDLAKELRDGLICPVLLGSAENGNGILRLLKALRHEAPFVERTAQAPRRREAPSLCAYVLKTFHTRAWRQAFARARADRRRSPTAHGRMAAPTRSASRGVFKCHGPGADQARRRRRPATPSPSAGSTHQDRRHAQHGEGREASQIETPAPTAAGVRHGHRRQGPQGRGEAHLGASPRSSRRIPRSRSTHSQDTGEMLLWGQGEMHLRVALERLQRKYGIDASTSQPRQIPYKETIRKSARECAAATRSNPAGTASSATWWSRSAAAARWRASNSPTRSPAAWCRKHYIPSVEIGVRDYLSTGRSASRWSMSR